MSFGRGRGKLGSRGAAMGRGGARGKLNIGGKRKAANLGGAPGGKRRQPEADAGSFSMWGDQPIAQQPLFSSNDWC